jgi:predicted ATPase
MTTLDQLLGELDTHGLIRQVQHDPDAEYQFRHVLTQEAAYGSLLKQDRRRLHLLVGEVLEREFTHRLDEVAPILAHHFDEAEEDGRALDYHIRAAQVAAARFANAEASMHYRRALELAQRLHAAGEQLIDLYLKHGRVLEISGQYTDALYAYLEMEMLAQERDDRHMLLAALMARATIYAAPTVLNDPQAGDELAQRALSIAAELNDRASEAKAWWLRMMSHRFTHHEAAIEYGERSAQIARELNLREQLAYALNDIFTSYMTSAQGPKALVALTEAEQIWRELDNPNLLADSLTSAGELLYFMGRLDEGIAKVNEAMQLSARTGNAWNESYARWMEGEVLHDRGDYPSAIAALQDSLQLGAQAGFAISQIATHGHLALIYAELGAYALGEDEARKSIEMAITLKPEWQGLGHAVLALCQHEDGRREEARDSLARAKQNTSIYDMSIVIVDFVEAEIDLAEDKLDAVVENMDAARRLTDQFGLLIFEPFVRYYSGVALLKLNRLNEAAAQLAAATALMDKLGMRRQLWEMLLAHAVCERRLRHDEAASGLEAAAGIEIDAIAHSLPQNLRETFLHRVDDVKRNLEPPEK